MKSIIFCLVTCSAISSGQVVTEPKKDFFLTYPQDMLVLFGEPEAEFYCSLTKQGVLIWSYGELLNELQIIAKGGEMKSTLPSVMIESFDASSEKLTISKIGFSQSGIYLCRDSLRKFEKYGKLLVYKIPTCSMVSPETFECELVTSIGVSTSAELICGNEIISRKATKVSVRSRNMVNKELRYVNSNYQWNHTNFTVCELKVKVELENTIHEFVSAKVTEVELNITSGYTLLQGAVVKCNSSAGFLSNFDITVTRNHDRSVYLTTTNDTFIMDELGTFKIDCTASGVFGLDSETVVAEDVIVNTTYTILPCEMKGAFRCFQGYSDIFDKAVYTRNVSLPEVQTMCTGYDRNCINYIQPCVWTRKINGLKRGRDFICNNLAHEFTRYLLNIKGGAECIRNNFLILPLKDVYLDNVSVRRRPLTPVDLIHESAVKFLEDAIKETCARRVIEMSVNKTVKEWIFRYRQMHFSSDINFFSEFIDENKELIYTMSCNESTTASPKNRECIATRNCIKILITFAELMYDGLLVVKNLNKFASESCDSSTKEIQDCAKNLQGFYTEHAIYMAINHITVFFDNICERYWSEFIKHTSCLQRCTRDNQFITQLHTCIRELSGNLDEYTILTDRFLSNDDQTSLCRRVSKFLSCQQKALTDICGEELAKLQRKFSRLAFSTNMHDLFCYNTFSY